MNEEIKKARKELLAGRNVEQSLPCYLCGLAGCYYRVAYYNLAMQYTVFVESVREGSLTFTGKAKDYGMRLEKQIKGLFGGTEKEEEVLTELFAIRDGLATAMQALTAYTDRLYLYEYVLRRLAPGIEGSVEDINNEAATKEILSYIFCDEEQEGLLQRLSAVVSELPVRMTRAKLFEWIRTVTAVYRDSDAEGLNRVFYMLYSATGMWEPEGMEWFTECNEVLEFLSSLSYKNLSEQEYAQAKERLEEITKKISDWSEAYFSLMEITNSLTMLWLTRAYVMPEDREAVKGAEKALQLLLNVEGYSDTELAEAFAGFEGAPEALEEFLFTEEGYFEELPVYEELLSAMLQKVLYTRVRYAKRLHTTSLFVELEEKKTENTTFDEQLTAFCEKLSARLEHGERALNRAIMAQVILSLPLPFTKSSEVQKYVLAALENCHDLSEKTAALREIRALTEEM